MDWEAIKQAILLAGYSAWEFGMDNIEAIVEWIRWDWVLYGFLVEVGMVCLWIIMMN